MTNVIAVYTGVLAAIFLVLSVRTIKGRILHKVALGDGNVPDMRARVRAHGNFAEYVPICLLLMWLLASQGYSAWVIHVLGIVLVVARVLHPFGVAIPRSPNPARLVGATGSLLVLGAGALLVLLNAVAGVKF